MFPRLAPAAPRRRFTVTMATVAIVVFSVLAGTGTSYAFWAANASRTVAATTGEVAVTVGGFAPGTVQNHVKQTVGYVTVTNTSVQNGASTTPAALTLTVVRDSGSTAFASAAAVVVWPAAGNSSANCTLSATATGAQGGNWNTGVPITGTLAKGATAVYCVRTTVDNPVAAGVNNGFTSFTAKVTATLAVHNFMGSASQAPSMSTAYIYPLGSAVTGTSLRIHVGALATGLCLDVSGNGGNATAAIPWGCHNDSNQQWQFTVVDSAYVRITPQHSTGVRLAATSTASGAQVQVITSNTGSQLQEWQLQLSGTGQYQLVNRATGYCLTSGSTTAEQDIAMTQAPCNGSLAQQFLPRLRSFACAVSGTGNTRTLQLSWTSTTGTRSFTIDGVAVTPTTNTATAITYQIARYAYTAGSTHSYTVTQSGVVVGAGTFKIDNSQRLGECTSL